MSRILLQPLERPPIRPPQIGHFDRKRREFSRKVENPVQLIGLPFRRFFAVSGGWKRGGHAETGDLQGLLVAYQADGGIEMVDRFRRHSCDPCGLLTQSAQGREKSRELVLGRFLRFPESLQFALAQRAGRSLLLQALEEGPLRGGKVGVLQCSLDPHQVADISEVGDAAFDVLPQPLGVGLADPVIDAEVVKE